MLALETTSPCAQVERQAERLEQPLGHRDGVLLVAEVLAEHGELVAAEAGDRLLAAQRVLQPLRHGEDQLVAGRVPEAVVDHLEAVEVEEEHRDVASRAGAGGGRAPRSAGSGTAAGSAGP